MIPGWIFFALLVELMVVSYFDLMTKKIKNMWPIINITFFIMFLFIYSEYYPFAWRTFSYSFVFLFVGFALFLVKVMGPGDTKFLFSFFLITPEQMHLNVLNKLLLFTAICAFIFLVFNVIKNFKKIVISIAAKDFLELKSCFGTKFAFAPVILVSWIWLGIEGGQFDIN